MPQKFKKLMAVILSAFIAILSSACTLPPDTADITTSLTVSTEPIPNSASEAASMTTVSKESEAKTAALSSSTENLPETEKSSDDISGTTEASIETVTETSTVSAAEITETTQPTAFTATDIPPETTTMPPAPTTYETETTVSSATEKAETTTEATAVETSAIPAETTVSAASETAAETTKPEELGSTYALTNPNASAEAQKLYRYISETYGKGIISGQQESTWMGSEQYEFEYIFDKTGKYPAIRGLDYMNDDFNGVNRRAEEWHKRGGIVTICWHCGCDFGGSWSECMNTEIKDWDSALTEGTEEYKTLISGMDKAAKALKELNDKNIPVLWRPFHELDGGWFWWGKGGAENFKKLWIIMHDRYTNYWELDNLIWVCGFSGNGINYDNWYPGDAYVDIAGADSYNDGANTKLYKLVKNFVGEKKPICFHECGRIPTAKQLQEEKADWVWFMTWHTEHITSGNDVNDLKEIYNDPYVITLDELPKW